MATPSCRARKARPDPSALSAIPVEARATPCPMQFGHQSTNTIEWDNQRPSKIYDVDFFSKSLYHRIRMPGGSYQWAHNERVLPKGSDHRDHSMDAELGSQGRVDVIQCTVKLYDSTQMININSFSGNKEIVDLTYDIKIS